MKKIFLLEHKPYCLYHRILGILLFLTISSWSHAEIVINEIHYHPRSDQLNSEYIELFNRGDEAIDLSGWQFQDGIDFTFREGTTIEAKSYLLLCRNEIFVRTHFNLSSSIKTTGNYAPDRLSNAGEEVRLEDAEGRTADRVEYEDNAPWPVQADGDGASLELVHPNVDNANAAYWKASIIPTPGKANTQLASEQPPRLIHVNQQPKIPASADAVEISIQVAEDDDIQSVLLNYRVNQVMSTTLEMEQEGSRFRAALPSQPNGTVVDYWILITSSSGFQLSAPPGQGDGRYLYKVDENPVDTESIIIHEIMYNNPVLLDEDEEWVELFNPNSSSMNLSHWMLKDSNDRNVFRFPPNTTIQPNGYLIVARMRNPTWPGLVVDGLSFALGNDGDEVRLFDPNGRLITEVEYSDQGEWPEGADGSGRSLELLQVGRPDEEPNNWAVSTPQGGTPGAPNSKAIDDPNYRDFDIVINELFYNPEDEEYDNNINKEYVELFNRSGRPVDLSGWYFLDGIEFEFPSGSVIAANGYLLIAKSLAEYPNVPNKVGNFSLRLNNAGETIALRSRNDVVIDFVDYNDRFPWPAMADGQGRSLECISPWADNTKAQYWRSGNPSTPGQANQLVLNNAPPRIRNVGHTPEFPQATSGEQQVESETILQVGDSLRYFKGESPPPGDWNSFEFDDSNWLSGRSGIGYGDNDDNTVLNDMRQNYLSVYVRMEFEIQDVDRLSSIMLNMDYDDSFIGYINGVEVARANVSGSPPRYNDSADGNHEAGTFESFGIPLQEGLLREGRNVLAIEGHNVSLTSSDLTLKPELETVTTISTGGKSQDTIVIAAEVDDADGVRDVVLHYQRLFAPLGTGLILEEEYSAPMLDDGMGNDEAAGDSVYTITLNDVTGIRPREIFRYRVSARDIHGVQAEVPLQDEEIRHFGLFVENGDDAPQFPTLYLFMENRFYQELINDPQSDRERPCVAVIDGEVFDMYFGGGARFRGHVLRNKPKKSWKIQFPKGKKWEGQRELNLNSNYQTSPLVRGESGYMEHMAYQFFRDMGFTVPDTMHRRIVLNNSYYGLFLQVEQYNKDFIDRHGLPETTRIFKAGVKARPTFMTREPNFESYVRKYEFMLGRDEDIQDLIDFIETLNSTNDRKAFFEANVDIQKYLDYLAAVVVLSHVDSTEKNYMPSKQADGTWMVFPWDMSHAWGEMFDHDSFPFIDDYSLLDGAQGGKFGTNRMRQLFLGMNEYREMYYQRLRDFTDALFTRERLDGVFDSYWNFLEDAVEENVDRWSSPGRLGRMVPEMKNYVDNRSEFILSHSNVLPADRPKQPVTEMPVESGSVNSRTVVLSVNTTGAVPFAAAEWMIQQGDDNFYQPIWQKRVQPEGWDSIEVPPTVLASDSTYYWRMRWKEDEGDVWSDWSEPTSFTTGPQLAVPDVQNVVVAPLNESVRIEWDMPKSSDLLRVDIFEGNVLVESTEINDNRVRIQDLVNGETHLFNIRVVTQDRRMSQGVLVIATPRAPLAVGEEIAYFRFEDNLQDETGRFTGTTLGSASVGEPGAENPVPLTGEENTASLHIPDEPGAGFEFGSIQPELDVDTLLTVECYVRLQEDASGSMILVDRYRETGAIEDKVWRFGIGLSNPGSLDFFLNDVGSFMGLDGRLHVASESDIVPTDGQFYHLAAVIDLRENSFNRKVRLYKDGFPVAASIVHDDGFSDYDSFRQDSDAPILVGARRASTGTADRLSGRMDELRLTNGALMPMQFLKPADVTPIEHWMMY